MKFRGHSRLLPFALACMPMFAVPGFAHAQGTAPSSALLAQNTDANTELYFSVQQLKQEVLELRGMVEELQHQVSIMQKQGRERYIDIDRRIQDISTSHAPVPVVSPSATSGVSTAPPVVQDEPIASAPISSSLVTPVAAPSQEESDAYQKAYELIKDKKFDAAIDALHEFIGSHPEGDLTANAYYWLGEVYLVAPKLEQAKAAFTVVINKFPKHRKAADALYKLGVVYQKLGRQDEAKTYLDQVIREYPESSAARLAAEIR